MWPTGSPLTDHERNAFSTSAHAQPAGQRHLRRLPYETVSGCGVLVRWCAKRLKQTRAAAPENVLHRRGTAAQTLAHDAASL